MKDQLISIIIPLYNKEKYIYKTLLSCNKQSYKNIEIIIIDDGSTDSSGEICKSFVEKDSRFFYYYHLNRGVSFTRNCGLKLAKGDWILFLDADDCLAPDYCEFCLESASYYKVDVLIISSEDKKEDNQRRVVKISKKSPIIWNEKNVKELQILMALGKYRRLNYNYTLDGPCCKIIKKSIINSISFPENLSLGEDTCFMIQVINNARSIAYIDKVLYLRNIVSNSLSYQKDIYKVNRVVDYVYWLIKYWENILPLPLKKRFIVRIYCKTLLEYLSYHQISLKKRKAIIDNAFRCIPIKFKYFVFMKPIEFACNTIYLLNSDRIFTSLQMLKKFLSLHFI